MWRKQTALKFCGVWLAGALMAGIALVCTARAADFGESLIGYDSRDMEPLPESVQAQPCQSCPVCPAGTACAGEGACQCSPAELTSSTNGSPMILTIGPPPRLYSPSADFGARVQSTPGWTVVGDGSTLFTSDLHPTTTAAVPCPELAPCSPPPMPTAEWSPFREYPANAPHLPQPVYFQPSPSSTSTIAPPMPVYAPTLAYGSTPGCLPTPSYAPQPVYAPPAYAPQPAYALAPAAYAYPTAANPIPTACEADRVDHMLQAIHHLEAAGLTAQADQIREQCDVQMNTVVEQLHTAQAELARLHQASYNQPAAQPKTHSYSVEEWMNQPRAQSKPATTWTAPQKQVAASSAPQQQVAVHVQLMELNRTKCQALGFDFTKFDGSHFAANHNCQCFESDSAFLSFLDVLKKEGLLTVTSAPRILARSGQEAHLEIGQNVPILVPHADGPETIEYKKIGTTVDVLPEALDGHKLRLHLRPCFSQLENSTAAQTGGATTPMISTTELETTLEMQSGQTAVLGGMTVKRERAPVDQTSPAAVYQSAMEEDFAARHPANAGEDIELLVLVHAEIVETDSTTKTVDLPTHPVVTAALSAPKNADHHAYTVAPAAYFAPVDGPTHSASHAAAADFMTAPAQPEPFVPQNVMIESARAGWTKAFAEPGESWGMKPSPAPFTASPVMVDSWIFTPDKR